MQPRPYLTRMFLPALILGLAVLLAGCAGPAYAQSGQPDAALTGWWMAAFNPRSAILAKEVTRTLTITGSGKVYLPPDVAYATISMQTEGENAAEAVTAKDAQVEAVTSALVAQGVAKEDIQTNTFSIKPQPEYDKNYKPTGKVKYIVDNSIFVTVRELSSIGDVLDAALKAGNATVEDIQFDVEERTAAFSEARQAAVDDARTKAEELAKAYGVSVGEVQTIQETTKVELDPMYQTRAAPANAETPAMPTAGGQMVITIEVSTVFEIR